jgi:hypothetical protein
LQNNFLGNARRLNAEPQGKIIARRAVISPVSKKTIRKGKLRKERSNAGKKQGAESIF